MKPQTLIEILDAAHLSVFVDSPFSQRGGIMLVGPPGVMKSTFINAGLSEWPNALILSDINVNQLMPLRDDLVTGRYRTLAFTAFEKIYQRHSATASNIEGSISALVEEGFSRASFEDQRMAALKARCLVVGAMPYDFYANHFQQWSKSGFLRRFLWCSIRLSDPDKIQDAIHRWELISMDCASRVEPRNKQIPYRMNSAQSEWLRKMVKDQPGDATPYVLLKKIFCVLSWKYSRQPKKARELLQDFAESLSKHGDEIEI